MIKFIENIRRKQEKKIRDLRANQLKAKNDPNFKIHPQYQNDRIEKMIVMGLKEVTNHAKAGNLKLVVVAPNLEKVQSKGGLDDAVGNLKIACNTLRPELGKTEPTPLAFALSRVALGRSLGRSVPISAIGIRTITGCEKEYKKVTELLKASQDSYGQESFIWFF